MKRPRAEAALVEFDTDPLFFSLDDVAGPFELIARYKQREVVRNEQGRHNFKRRARI